MIDFVTSSISRILPASLFPLYRPIVGAGLAAVLSVAGLKFSDIIADWAEVDNDVRFTDSDCTLFYGAVAVIASLLIDLLASRRLDRPLNLPVVTVGASILAVTLAAVIGTTVLRHFANSADEWGYLFQADTYAQGRLTNPSPPLGAAMAACWTWVVGQTWVGQYPPGWPLILCGFGLVGVPYWMVGLIVGGLSVGLLALLTWQSTDHTKAALLAAVTWALSPFLLFNAASYYSHAATAAFCLGFAIMGTRYLSSGRLWVGVTAGMLLGAAATTRYAPAVFIAVPYAVTLLALPIRRWTGLFGLGLGALPFVIGLSFYQFAITGDPFKPVYWVGGRATDHLYFDLQTMVAGMIEIIPRGSELGDWLFPLALPGYLVALVWKTQARTSTFVDFMALALIVLFSGPNPRLQAGKAS
ncbi:MAG: hypothetical protein WCJ64_21060, partial [Rhodospirillaceae bacterium]